MNLRGALSLALALACLIVIAPASGVPTSEFDDGSNAFGPRLSMFLAGDCSSPSVGTLPIQPNGCDSSPFDDYDWMSLRLNNVTNEWALLYFMDDPEIKPCSGEPIYATYGQGEGCQSDMTHFGRVQGLSLWSLLTTSCQVLKYFNAMCIGLPYTTFGVDFTDTSCHVPMDPKGRAEEWSLSGDSFANTKFMDLTCSGGYWANHTGTLGQCSDAGLVVTCGH